MENKIRSGKEVIDDFFAEILNIEGTDEKTVEKLIELYSDNKLTDSNIQNALEELKQDAISPKKSGTDGKD
ncbi:hypothetical protein SAMN05444285_1712 [Draconibacterium orientale]|uniref:Uncharacterized protein n=1 Tax=Draconibacterium orientale TaxID=1168034 RepID=X5DUY4_9BACT|nr:hypothetical protein [Draconibacterium orientale]AHW58995.1 hypothetical protein FH5T_03670 [Draconibacterium orientale]SEU16743.1 hypothetical protein SAMN05444285_1712 [Draconibacterium orientale]